MSDKFAIDSFKTKVQSVDFKTSLALGDDAAFEELFYHYQKKLFNYINKIVKCDEVSEELVLDIFLKIWNAKEMILEVKNVDAFLYRMAVNKALDFLKAAAREKKLRDLLVVQMNLVTTEAADDVYIYKEYEQQLRLTIQQLPPQQQLIFNLSREGGLSHQQISDKLNISKHTVKNHLVTVIKRLKGILGTFLFFF